MFQPKDINNRLNDNDLAYLEYLYKEYKTVIYNYLIIKTKNDIDASNDVLSETFCSIINSLDRIKNFDNIKGYLLKIADRRLSDFLRKKYHDKNYNKYFDAAGKMEDALADDLHTKEQLLMVNLAMDKLKPLFREVIRLKHIEERSQNEIAGITGKSVSAVETLLVRARKQLRIELKKIKGFMHET